MAGQLTNKMLAQLLGNLRFEYGELAEKEHRVWRHPESGCTVLLPENEALQPLRAANLVGLKAQLDLQGHQDEDAIEFFLPERRLPARSAERA